MTAEVAILNKSAATLAADSAVTVRSIRRGSNGREPTYRTKIYTNANKLFELIKGRSVGIMIFDSAELLQVPWETLVKIYRDRKRGTSKSRLQEYSEDFCQFIAAGLDGLAPRDARLTHVLYIVRTFAEQVLNNCERRLVRKAEEDGVRITQTLRRATLDDALQELEESWEKATPQAWSDGLSESDLMKEYGGDALDIVPTHLETLKLNESYRRRLRDVALKAILRMRKSPLETGVVIAGFGEDDVFPAMTHLQIGGAVCDRLILTVNHTENISTDRPALIQPFAQTDEASTFLMGIDPEVKDAVESFWMEWTSNLDEATATILQHESTTIASEEAERVSARMKEFGEASWRVFAGYMNDLHMRYRFKPIEDSAAFLAKAELAALAENLVNLASLRNRVAIDREETVGGAIDVAVISKGDGFVWIKRKHYFEPVLNPTWASRQLEKSIATEADQAAKEGS